MEKGADSCNIHVMLAAVQHQIEVVANTEQLQHLNDEMKQKFADRFPPKLSPIDDLPTNVYHHFKLRGDSIPALENTVMCGTSYCNSI